MVRENPYLLAEEVWGIGFSKADAIARGIGFSTDDPRRVAAGIIHVLRRAADDGHCFLHRDDLINTAGALLGVDRALVEDVLSEAASVEKVISEDDRIYLTSLHSAETDVARMLAEIATAPAGQKVSLPMAESLFNEVQRESEIQFTGEQRQAIIGAISEKVMVITGGPGTGKTTIIRAILRCAKRLRWDVRLAAPTGRAAKKLEEKTSYRAQTIHRLLKFNPGLGKFEHSHQNPLDTDMLILDEVSMIDIDLMRYILSSLRPGARLLLVGDADQLPSVGPGAVLRDIIASRRIKTTKLSQIMRQDEHGLIVRNAHRILHGKTPFWRNHPDDDFFFLERQDSSATQTSVIDLVCRRIPRRYNLDPAQDIQVITPMHKGKCGVRELNALLSEKLNPQAKRTTTMPFAVGDRVMQTTNNYDIGVFNGDIGVVIATDEDKREIVVRFPETDATYDSSFWGQLVQAYAITVHKSQGSEYPAVVMPLLTEHYIMLARNLLYTAITRAQTLIVIVGSRKALEIAVRNNKPMCRNTALAERIREFLDDEH